jgi:hypothetical protein
MEIGWHEARATDDNGCGSKLGGLVAIGAAGDERLCCIKYGQHFVKRDREIQTGQGAGASYDVGHFDSQFSIPFTESRIVA